MTNKAKSSKRNKRILICATAIFLVLIVALAYVSSLNQHGSTQPPQKASSAYFLISDFAGVYAETGGTSIRISQFAFTFTPIGGDATHVRIFAREGNLNPLDNNWEATKIPNGTATFSGQMYPGQAIYSYRQSDGNYNMTIRIACVEADGPVVIYFNATNGIVTGI